MYSKQIFEKAGFDIDILGSRRIKSSGACWRSDFRKDGVSGLNDTRCNNSGRPRVRELTPEEILKRKDAEIDILKLK